MSRFVTRLFDLFFTPRFPEPYAGPAHRWLLWLSFVVVMLIFPGLAFLSALIGLADVIAGRPIDPLGDYSLATSAANVIFTALPIGLAWVFLRLSGDRLIRVGLVARPARETARATWWTFVWIFVLGSVFHITLGLLFSVIPYADRFSADVQIGSDVSFGQLAAVGIPAAICAGLLEEIVVLGFAYRILERLGLSDRAILAVLVALRMSFHLYYGLTALVLLPWAYLSVIYYRRYRRLWPLIIGHAVWDVYAILSSVSDWAALAGLLVTGLILLAVIIVAIVRWFEVRRGPLLTLQIPRPAPLWKHDWHQPVAAGPSYYPLSPPP